jgi:hypothetical protein
MPSHRPPASPALEKLRRAKLRETEERILRLKRENAQAAGEVVSAEDVVRLVHVMNTTARAVLFCRLEEAPVRLEGLDAATIRAKLRDIFDEVCDGMQKSFANFKWSVPPRLPDAPDVEKAKAPAKRKKARK